MQVTQGKAFFTLVAVLTLCLSLSCSPSLSPSLQPVGQVRVGTDRLFEEPYWNWIQGKRVGLITNPTGVDSRLEATMDLLAQHPDVQLVALFAPEHGLLAQAQAEEAIATYGNVYSLYGETQAPTSEMLKGVEVLLYDIQDVGVRFYTYISTMFLSMKAATEQGIPFIVLDRPNPIDGSRVEGPVLQPGYESFVGIYALPIRYGMTAGELARLLNQETNLGCDLKVVPLEGWQRQQWYDQTGLKWISPSPNMSTVNTASRTDCPDGRQIRNGYSIDGVSFSASDQTIVAGMKAGLCTVTTRSAFPRRLRSSRSATRFRPATIGHRPITK